MKVRISTEMYSRVDDSQVRVFKRKFMVKFWLDYIVACIVCSVRLSHVQLGLTQNCMRCVGNIRQLSRYNVHIPMRKNCP